MSKFIDWDQNYKSPLGKNGVQSQSGKAFAQAAEVADRQKRAQEEFKAIEPEIKKSLLDHMLKRTPIRVVRPFKIITEILVKSDRGASYQEGAKVVPEGTELTFVQRDRTMGQWIFKSQNGEEFEIYDRPTMVMNQRYVPNPGFWGLLTCTHIYDEVVAKKGDE